jgi:hypothetical protein
MVLGNEVYFRPRLVDNVARLMMDQRLLYQGGVSLSLLEHAVALDGSGVNCGPTTVLADGLKVFD